MAEALSKIEAQILEVGGHEYKKQKEEVEQHRSKVLEKEKQYKKLKQIQETSEASVRKIDGEIQNSEEQILTLQKDLETLQLKIKENEVKANEIMKNNEEYDKTRKECD